MKYLFTILILITSYQVSACLNEYKINEQGQESHFPFEGLPIFHRRFAVNHSNKIVSSVDLSKKEEYSFQTLSDVGVHLSHLGRYKESLALFQSLYKEHKDEYQIVANLGTLYELNGEVDSAYKYIEKAMELNPNSHGGSEWVHLSILQAKQKIAQDPSWIKNNQVLNLNLSTPIGDDREKETAIIRTVWHISHQLEERIPFTPDRDLLLPNILIELGDILRVNISIEDAYIVYMMAQHYDPENVLGVFERIEKLKPLLKAHDISEAVFQKHFPGEVNIADPIILDQSDEKEKSNTGLIVMISIGVLLVFIGVFFFIWKAEKQ